MKPTGTVWRNWKKKQGRKRVTQGLPWTPEHGWDAEWECAGAAESIATLDTFQSLVSAAKRPISFEDLCNKIGKPPGETRKLIGKAIEMGISLRVGGNHVHLSPEEQVRTVQQSNILPTSGVRQMVGVISDLHLGSKYCLREQLVDCINYFYSRGIDRKSVV